MDIQREPRSKRKRYVVIGAVALTVVAATVALARLEPAPPSVNRATVWVDTVQRGTLIIDVRGPGTLVPEEVQLISAVTAGRVERLPVLPGVEVDPETVLLELANPDVQVEMLQAQRSATEAEARLVDLRSALANDRLTQRSTVAQAEADYLNARRVADNNEPLAELGVIAQAELVSSRERAEALATRLEVARERLDVIESAAEEQIRAQTQQVERLQAIADFQRRRVESMIVRAGEEGVLTDLPLEEGQWVTPGQMLARVVKPFPLKAEIRIPETQAADVVVGQSAFIDLRNDTIPGVVQRIDPAAESGTVLVDVRLEGELPSGARPQLNVQGTVEVARLEDALKVGRPAYGQAHGNVGLFRLVRRGNEAVRVTVRLGMSAVNEMEIVEGLSEGDVVILSDMSQWDSYERVRLN